jgi:glycerol-3-phosphate O-acyltransferase
MTPDDITAAVLAHEEVTRYLRGGHGQTPVQARERVDGYLDELRTTQRYSFYRALKHPLYPILRKIDRKHESIDIVKSATLAGRVVYVSNHKSHTDYLIEPLVLDDNGVRPPIIAAGINLFGGPMGFIHRHVTGAIPIRRATKDPGYLITLKAYVAELLRLHDLLFYFEGGRSYSGELKPAKTGLIQATLQAECAGLVIIPTAIAYDLVLEDRILSKQGVKRNQRPFTRELAEMVGQAVRYQSRAFVTFGAPIPVGDYDAQSKKASLDLAHRVRETIGLLYKVLPTALVAAAMRSSLTRRDLQSRIDLLLDKLAGRGANLAVTDAGEAVDDGVRRLTRRGIIVSGGGRVRVRDRIALRYYAHTIAHLLDPDDKA